MSDPQPSQAATEAAREALRGVQIIDMVTTHDLEQVARRLDAFARDAVRAAVERCCECICQGCAEEMPLLEPAVHGRQYNEHGDIEGGPCAADSIRRAFADVLEGRE